MHDWILLSIRFDWESARATFLLRNKQSQEARLIAEDVVDLHVPHADAWGPSVGINTVMGPASAGNAVQTLVLEMQSGDRISVVAKAFVLPDM